MCWNWVCYCCATTYFPANSSGRIARRSWPLFLYHVSLPVGLVTFPPPLFHYLSITIWPFPTRLVSLHGLFFFRLIDRSRLQTFPTLPFDTLFFPLMFVRFDLFSSLTHSLFARATASPHHTCSNHVCDPLRLHAFSPLFVLLSRGQCGHYRRGAAAPAGGGGVPPRRVCQRLLPRLAGAAEPGREFHTHPGLGALWHC